MLCVGVCFVWSVTCNDEIMMKLVGGGRWVSKRVIFFCSVLSSRVVLVDAFYVLLIRDVRVLGNESSPIEPRDGAMFAFWLSMVAAPQVPLVRSLRPPLRTSVTSCCGAHFGAALQRILALGRKSSECLLCYYRMAT